MKLLREIVRVQIDDKALIMPPAGEMTSSAASAALIAVVRLISG